MAFVTLEDAGGKAEVWCFRKSWKNMVSEADKVVRAGRLYRRRKFDNHCDELKDLPNDVIYAQALSEMQKSSQLVIFMEQLAGIYFK